MASTGVVLGLGALALLLLSGSSEAAPSENAAPPPLPPPPPTPPKKTSPPAHGDYSFFNYATGQAVDPNSFLNWAPGGGGGGGGSAPAAPPAAVVVLPKAGEKWQQVWSLNRPLSYFELSAAKNAFSSQMPGQTLDSAIQHPDVHTTVTVTSTFTKDATAPIPVGQVIKKLDIVATLTSAQRIG